MTHTMTRAGFPRCHHPVLARSRGPLVPLLVAALILVLASACGSDDGGPVDPGLPEAVASVAIQPGEVSLYYGPEGGDTRQLSAVVTGTSGSTLTGRVVTWSSDDPGVATVDGTGRVEAVGEGTTTIRATVEGTTGSVQVASTYDRVVGIDLPSEASLILGRLRGETRALEPSIRLLSGRPSVGRTLTWSSSDETAVTVTSAGLIAAAGRGTAQITAEVEGVSAVAAVESNDVFEREVPSVLSDTHPGTRSVMRVIEIRVLPTDDGVWMDSTRIPDYWTAAPRTLGEMHERIDSIDVRKKYAMAEGSRFRGYASDAPPGIDYEVVKIFTLYRLPPLLRTGVADVRDVDGGLVASVDFEALFEELGIVQHIDALDVAEVWMSQASFRVDFPSYTARPEAFDLSTRFRVAESAMSSPNGECVSNSYLEDCRILPRAGRTYVVYGDSYQREWGCTVHNRGHHLERVMGAVDRHDLFWGPFTGHSVQTGEVGQGRVGNVHFPPNGVQDYDYWNATPVPSDIEDWRPEGGPRVPVNFETWQDIPYRYPDEGTCGGQWLIYWMQAFPGHESGLTLNGAPLENWWDAYARWDDWRASGRSLVQGAVTAGPPMTHGAQRLPPAHGFLGYPAPRRPGGGR